MPVLPNPLDANVNNPSTFSSFSGGKKKRTMKKRNMKKRTMKKRKSKCKR